MSKYGLSVIIPTRNEPLLRFTVENIVRVRGVVPVQICIINDGGQKVSVNDFADLLDSQTEIIVHNLSRHIGLGYCRDLAIREIAKYDFLFVVDAHMDFAYNSFEPLIEYLKEHPDHLTCFKVRGLDPDSKEWANSEYYGADIRILNYDARQGQGKLFPSKWTTAQNIREKWKNGEVQEICGILGACYGMTRSNYIHKLLCPWGFLRGWGTSEQNISIPNWLMGGKNVLLPMECAHNFRPKGGGHEVNVHDIIFNQLRLLSVLEMSEELFKYLKDYLYQQNKGYNLISWGRALDVLDNSNPGIYKNYLIENGKRDFAGWMEYFNIENPLEAKEK